MSIAYLDPGNIESDLQSGAKAGFKVFCLSSIFVLPAFINVPITPMSVRWLLLATLGSAGCHHHRPPAAEARGSAGRGHRHAPGGGLQQAVSHRKSPLRRRLDVCTQTGLEKVVVKKIIIKVR